MRITNILFRELRILKINDINKLQVIQFISKSNCTSLPLGLQTFYDKFHFSVTQNNYSTRSGITLCEAPYRTNVRKYSIFCDGIKVWNSLPPHIKEGITTYSIKKRFIDYALNLY